MEQDFVEYKDSFGSIKVRKDKLWGAQTQRSIENFDIYRRSSIMPIQIIHGFAILKKASATINKRFGLNSNKVQTIVKVCDEILSSKWDDQFPLVVWQTGSGTQSNMNVNQVISNRGQQILPGIALHPNNDVNMGQSSNDTFPTAMHIATTLLIQQSLIPSLKGLIEVFQQKQEQFKDVIKIGRTHTQDATPISLGQQFSGYTFQLKNCLERINKAKTDLLYIALGGTAVGTGLNSFEGFAQQVAKQIAKLTNYPFVTAPNKFQSLACHDGLVNFHGTLNTLAVSLNKIANDIRFLGSGPRAGLGQLKLPQNEQGSSIMPGKVNPTQCQAITMVCAQVIGNNVTVTMAGSNGHFQLNVFKPVIVLNTISSIHLLADSMKSFNKHCVIGIKPNKQKIQQNLNNSLMIITALAPCIGYNLAGEVAKNADKQRTTLKDSFFSNQKAKQALKDYLKVDINDEQLLRRYQQIIDPSLMLKPSVYKQQ